VNMPCAYRIMPFPLYIVKLSSTPGDAQNLTMRAKNRKGASDASVATTIGAASASRYMKHAIIRLGLRRRRVILPDGVSEGLA